MKIPVYAPSLTGNERHYVNACLDSTWISSKGTFIDEFETRFAAFIGGGFSVSVCNGTVALHLALVCLGLGPGDEVIVPTLTYIASVNTIAQVGAKPVFVDSLVSTWQMDPADVRRKINPRTRAVVAVHLYGQTCDLTSIAEICREHGLLLIEDCAEAIGTKFGDKHVGLFGDIGTFSFFGNKTITTGEGGMLTTKSPDLCKTARLLRNQSVSPDRTYWHETIGYNYRMTNICAAIGVAQMEQVDQFLKRKREIAALYQHRMDDLPIGCHLEADGTTHSYWMCSILVPNAADRDALRKHLIERDVETRPVFYPAHIMPAFLEDRSYPVAEAISSCGINLPSWPGMSNDMVEHVCRCIREFYRR